MRRVLLSLTLSLAPVLFAQSVQPPDLIVTNARVFTGDAANKWAQAVAITGDHISAVGTNEQVASTAGGTTRRIDAGGRLVIPGLNDAHEHLCTTPSLQLSTTPDSTGAEVLAAIASATDESAADVWVSGVIGAAAIDDPSLTVAAIDKVSAGHRVMLQSWTGHVVIPNSSAMQSLRVNDSRDPIGGWWTRDASGRSTGRAYEYAGYDLQRRWADLTSEEDAIDDIKAWGDRAAKLGVTTIQVMPCLAYNRFERLARRSSLPIRVRVMAMPGTSGDTRSVEEIRRMPKPYGARAMLDVSGIKWILDGTPIERGAAMTAPYPGTKENGRINFSNTEIAAMFKEAIDLDEQNLFHVSGDRTTAAVLDVMKDLGRTDWKARRVRFEHGDGITAATLPAVRDYGIVVVHNPTHQGPFAKARLVKTLVKNGVPLALGSDGPPITPWADVQLAITNPANRDEGLTREEALTAYTQGSAYAEMAEKDKGTLAPGKLADLAVLSQDIFKVPESSIPETTSVLTIVNGKIAYDSHLLK